MERTQKENLVGELKETFDKAKAVFLADFKGLSMETMASLRRKLKQSDCQIKITKNTLIKLAAKDGAVAKLESLLIGNNALGFTEKDPTILAKVLWDFAKDNEKFVIKGGVLQDRKVDANQIKALAVLPSREVLLATLLGTMQAVPASLVRVLAAMPKKLLYALSAIRDAKSA
ncbi:MAG: 50S ribosomal protein L10 [Deltaproteobacteria bacterium]|jgi:large subunit ribosomal protein L10|nr:50S ribosomal protein L10 [Deltaproteobacteria bacterium]